MYRRLLCLVFAVLAGVPAAAQFATFPAKKYFLEQWMKVPYDVQVESVGNIEDFVVDAKIELSLRAYLELVMANSPNVNLQKLSVYQGQNAIQRALSPFDPRLTANYDGTRSVTPSSDQLQGAAVRSQLTHVARFNYQELLDTGTTYAIDFTARRTSDNSAFSTFNPAINQTLDFSISQQLLRGRGRGVQRIPILIAESRLEQSRAQVRDQIINLIFRAENDYWTVISTREQLRVQENNVELARASLERSRRELELGAISPLDIYQPEERFASAQVQVTQAFYRLKQAEDAVRSQMGADLHPDLRNMPLVLTESSSPPVYTPDYDPEETVAKALLLRPDVEQRRRALEIDDFNIKGSTDEMRPELSIRARYGGSSRSGTGFERSLLGGTSVPVTFGGAGDALDQLFRFKFPTYSFGLTLNLPLANRRAAADLADATIQKKRDLYQLRSVEQSVRLDVLQALSGLESSEAAVKQAVVAQDFARKRLDAEQRKYDLGVNTIFFVLDAQDKLVVAEASLVNQAISYRRAMLTLLQATGELLEQRGVTLRYEDYQPGPMR